MRDDEEAVEHVEGERGHGEKESLTAIASRWLLRNLAHRLSGSGFFGAFLIHRQTVRSEMSKQSIFSSP
jgi:hypothetical protein